MDRAEQIKVHVNQLKEGNRSQRTDVTFPKESFLHLTAAFFLFLLPGMSFNYKIA